VGQIFKSLTIFSCLNEKSEAHSTSTDHQRLLFLILEAADVKLIGAQLTRYFLFSIIRSSRNIIVCDNLEAASYRTGIKF
jgi:hypothetical protein